MSARLGLWLVLAAAGWAFSFWVYRHRELAVPARTLLATLRGGAIALVLLLLMDLTLPGSGGVGEPWVLVDASSSMRVPQGAAGVAPWDEARELLDAGSGRRLAFGPATASPGEGAGEGSGEPVAGDSRLAPALTQALEAGATRVEIVSDLRVDDPVEVEALLRAARVPVVIRDVGGEIPNAGVASLDFPQGVRAGAAVQGSAEIFGSVDGPARVVVERDGTVVWDSVVTLSAGGRVTLPLRLEAPDDPGAFVAAVWVEAEGDRFAADDRRSTLLEVDPPSGELVLVSWEPDWEPRFLLPVLAEVTGLQSQGYLRVGEDRYLTMRGDPELVEEAEVLRRLEDARLAVVHAVPGDPDAGLARILERAPRLLRVPGTTGEGGSAGEWYLSPEIPPSPLAGELSGVPLLGLPPLRAFGTGRPSSRAAILLQLAGRGDPVPGLVLAETAQGRRVDAVAEGFWRWHMREGAGRELYRRLWSGVAGWLLASRGTEIRAVGIGPMAWVNSPGEPLEWRAGPAAGGTVELAWTGPGGEELQESLVVDSLGRARGTAPVTQGRYLWRAQVPGEDGPEREAEGTMLVEARDLDLRPPRAVSLATLAGEVDGASGNRGGRPLRTHPIPYLLLLTLLVSEWVVRRRSGLR